MSAYDETWSASGNYARPGVATMLDAATSLYRRRGQRRAAKSAQFERVRALRIRLATMKG